MLRKLGIGVALALLTSMPAMAAVRYQFTYTVHGGQGGFAFTAPDYIASLTDVDPSQTEYCDYVYLPYTNQTCDAAQRLDPNGSGSDFVRYAIGGSQSGFYFVDGAFLNDGQYLSYNSNQSMQARLLVNRVASSAVPEPASWALMVAGFGLAGWQLRQFRAPRRSLARA